MITYIALAVLLAVIIYSKEITNIFVILLRRFMTRNSVSKPAGSTFIPSTIS